MGKVENLARFGVFAIAAYELSRYAFTVSARKELGKRDEWTCQGLYGQGCIWEREIGHAASHQEGYYVQAAHYPEKHNGHDDPRTENGRVLCLLDHATEELLRNNTWGAKKLLQSGVYTFNKADELGEQIYASVDDLKEYLEEMRPYYEEYLFSLKIFV